MKATILEVYREVNFLNEQHQAFGAILHVGNVTEKHVTKTLESYNLPLNEYRILRGLRRVHPKGVGVYKLREFLIDQKADISRLVEKMVKRNLVERNTDPSNKSVSQITITADGLSLVNEVEGHMPEIITPAMSLNEEEARQLTLLLEKVLAAFPEE